MGFSTSLILHLIANFSKHSKCLRKQGETIRNVFLLLWHVTSRFLILLGFTPHAKLALASALIDLTSTYVADTKESPKHELRKMNTVVRACDAQRVWLLKLGCHCRRCRFHSQPVTVPELAEHAELLTPASIQSLPEPKMMSAVRALQDANAVLPMVVRL